MILIVFLVRTAVNSWQFSLAIRLVSFVYNKRADKQTTLRRKRPHISYDGV